MAKINQLSFEVANLIAAGEVVDRPSSVAKELLENAIDAGGTQITLEIKNGGVSFIRVADNGCGIEREDLPVAIRRHATSKIKDSEDLDAIATLGFRGEALAAIAAVSTLTIITKTKENECGYMLSAVAGKEVEVCEVGCADGTTVTVENLFDNVPARRKFLKKDATETQAVAALAERIALSHPEIAFTFLADGRRRFATPGDGNLVHTLYALYGREFASRLLNASATVGNVTVSGCIGLPDNARSTRSYQHVFVNGRYVHSKTATAAIERAYTSYMAPEKFPVCALFITVPVGTVDVNVHPAKLEVKFSDERAVFEAVYYALRDALTNATQRPELHLTRQNERDKLTKQFAEGEKGKQLSFDSPHPVQAPNQAPAPKPRVEGAAPYNGGGGSTAKSESAPVPVRETLSPADSLPIIEKTAAVLQSGVPYTATPQGEKREEAAKPTPAPIAAPPAPVAEKSVPVAEAEAPSEPVKEEPLPVLPPYRIVGQLFDCYIFVELEDGVSLVIDQHAAHERLLFEDMKKKRQNDKGVPSQELLIPLSLSLSPEDVATAEENKDEFAALGFSCRFVEGRGILTAIPVDVKPSDAEGLFVSMCEALRESAASLRVSEEMRRERMLYQIACKAAIKGGRKYDEGHIRWLVEQVLAMPDVTVCPHGRPVAFYLTKKEIDRRFERLK